MVGVIGNRVLPIYELYRSITIQPAIFSFKDIYLLCYIQAKFAPEYQVLFSALLF